MEADDTIQAYEQRVDRYLAAYKEPLGDVLAWQDRFVELVGAGETVLEVGSGPGADADRLERAGLRVLRSDAARAFAERLRALGHDVLDLDVRRDPLPGRIRGVYANAVLLHLDREELSAALLRLRSALPAGGVLACTLKEGDGEEWHDRKLGVPRRFTYWRADPLRAALDAAGFTVLSIDRSAGRLDDWLLVLATA